MSDSSVRTRDSIQSPIVRRQVELDLIEAEISKRRKNGPASGPTRPRSVIVLYGTAGIGKTTFIEGTLVPHLADNYSFLSRVAIDFDTEVAQDRYKEIFARGQLIIDLVYGLLGSINETPPVEFIAAQLTWQKAVGRFPGMEPPKRPNPATIFQAEEELVELFNLNITPLLTSQPEHRPAIIILDTVEQISRDFLKWIQQSLQAPSTDTGYVLWIMAGRQPVDCYPFFLQSRFYWHQLLPFSEEEVSVQAEEQAQLAPVLYDLGQGLPAATEQLLKEVRKIESRVQHRLDAAELEHEHREELLFSLSELLQLDRFVGSVEPLLQASIRVLSPLRMLSIGIVLELLPKTLQAYASAEQNKGRVIDLKGFVDELDVLQQMLGTMLVSWDRSHRGYVIEEPLRQIIARVLEHEHKEIYEDVHRKALDLFRGWSQTAKERRRDYMVEALYHHGVIARRLEGASSAKAASQMVKILEEMVKRYHSEGDMEARDALDQLKRQIESDRDFAELLTDKDRKRLLKALEVPMKG